MDKRTRLELPRLFPVLVVADLVGMLLLGFGIWALVADDEIPMLEGYDPIAVGAAMVVIGVALILPLVVGIIRTARRNQGTDREP